MPLEYWTLEVDLPSLGSRPGAVMVGWPCALKIVDLLDALVVWLVVLLSAW